MPPPVFGRAAVTTRPWSDSVTSLGLRPNPHRTQGITFEDGFLLKASCPSATAPPLDINMFVLRISPDGSASHVMAACIQLSADEDDERHTVAKHLHHARGGVAPHPASSAAPAAPTPERLIGALPWLTLIATGAACATAIAWLARSHRLGPRLEPAATPNQPATEGAVPR